MALNWQDVAQVRFQDTTQAAKNISDSFSSIASPLQDVMQTQTDDRQSAMENAIARQQADSQRISAMSSDMNARTNLSDSQNRQLIDNAAEARAVTENDRTVDLFNRDLAADNLAIANAADAKNRTDTTRANLEGMNRLLADPSANNIDQLQNIAAYGQATGIDSSKYNDILNTKRLTQARTAIQPIPDLGKVTEQEAVDLSNQINSWIDTNMPLATATDKAAAVTEMEASTGLDNVQARIEAAKTALIEANKAETKFQNDKKLKELDNQGNKDVAWIKNNSSGASSTCKTKMLDRLGKMEFATDDFLLVGDTPGTALMNKLSPMIASAYPNASDQNKVWKYLSTSGFPSTNSTGRNSFVVSGIEIGDLKSEDLKSFINKSGILDVKVKTDDKPITK